VPEIKIAFKRYERLFTKLRNMKKISVNHKTTHRQSDEPSSSGLLKETYSRVKKISL